MTKLFPDPSAIEAATDKLRGNTQRVLDYAGIIGDLLNDSTNALVSLPPPVLESYLNECGAEKVGQQMTLHYTLGSAINAAAGQNIVDVSSFDSKLAARGLALSFDGAFHVAEIPIPVTEDPTTSPDA